MSWIQIDCIFCGEKSKNELNVDSNFQDENNNLIKDVLV